MDDQLLKSLVIDLPRSLKAKSIKYWQNLMIYQAGMCIMGHKKMKNPEKYSKMVEAIKGKAEQIIDHPVYQTMYPVGMVSQNLLDITFKNYTINVTPGKKDKIPQVLTGELAWNRFLKIKADITHMVAAFKSATINGIPSGLQFLDVLVTTKERYYKKLKDDEKKLTDEGKKEEKKEEKKDNDEEEEEIDDKELPLNWLPFIKHGSPAGKLADEIWIFENEINLSGDENNATGDEKNATDLTKKEKNVFKRIHEVAESNPTFSRNVAHRSSKTTRSSTEETLNAFDHTITESLNSFRSEIVDAIKKNESNVQLNALCAKRDALKDLINRHKDNLELKNKLEMQLDNVLMEIAFGNVESI